MNPLIKEIFQDDTLNEGQGDQLYSKLKKTQLKKGGFLLKAQDRVNDLFYVHSGCVRSYILDLEGKEHTLQFAVKGWWISDYIALYGRKKIPAVSYIECIKEATLYSLSKSEFDTLCINHPNVALLHKKKMELAFASFQNRILENLTLTAKQQYLNFLNAYPAITNDVKNYHIASYLGITKESLSRIRKELSNQ